MNKLLEARAKINDIDSRMAALFTQRWEAVRDIARYKMERGIPILDQGREREILEKNSALIPTEDIRASYISFMQHELDLSKQFQHMLMEGMNVAYCGVPGTLGDTAACRIFADARHVGFPDFKAAYDAVVSGDCDCALLPVKNSTGGVNGQVIDLLFTGNLFINGMYVLSAESSADAGAAGDTEFAVLSRIENLNSDKRGIFILMFTVPDAAGSLAKAISVISDHGFNMKGLRAIALKSLDGQDCFYVEAEGDEASENGREMLEELAAMCGRMKVAGHYQKAVGI